MNVEKLLCALRDRFEIQEFPHPVNDRVIFQCDGKDFYLKMELADEPLGEDEPDDYLDIGEIEL